MERSTQFQGFGAGPQSGPISIVQAVPRVPSTLSVSAVDVNMMSGAPSRAFSTLTLTPGRTRDIDQDMEALRISRHDNPFLQQVLASQESLAESLEESESDDANLMTQGFPSDSDPDPLTLPEIHEHMIRSPPPTSWPRSPNYKVFRFPGSDDDSSQESLPVRKSPSKIVSPRQPRGVLVLEEMARDLIRSPASQDRMSSSGFSLLSPAPIRSLSEVRRLHSRNTDDNEQLVSPESEVHGFGRKDGVNGQPLRNTPILPMDIAKTLFGGRPHEGYGGKQDYNEKVETAVSDDEDSYVSNYLDGLVESSTLANDGPAPSPGGPFSALTPSMWPQDILSRLGQQSDDPNAQPEYRFDEFGFRVEEEDGPEQNSNKLLGIPFVEDPQHRLQWVAHLEFSHNKDVCDLTWDNVETRLPRTEKLRSMVRTGIPHSLRPQVWMRLSGALEKKMASELCYKDVVKASSSDALMTSKQIEKDLLRTMPGNVCFSHLTSTGIPRLRRVLRGLAWLYPEIGYCQGTAVMAASLLLLMEEEDAFWLMSTIVEELLPASYYSSTLIGVQADQRVLRSLISSFLPDVDVILKDHDIELSLITLQWFLTLFASVVHMKILLRIWDLFFFDGSIVLFQVTLGMLKLKEPNLKTLENSAQIFNALSDIPGDVDDVDQLLQEAFEVSSSLNDMIIETHRRRHLAYLMADQGGLVGNPETMPNLPKQHLSRRQVKKNKSMFQLLLFRDDEGEEDIKLKNVKQTEILVSLREAILQVARHFLSVDPKLNKVVLVPDYSMESHSLDQENYVNVSRTRKRRAKALLDFERHDDDELGFRKNDIITIVSQKDEHCWVGELNGLRGWFPAKFVELLDERSKQYSCAGDDAVSEAVTDLVRGTLCPAIKQVLEHGMKRPSFLGGSCHPWLFIEEACTREVEKDFNSVYSRLVLCKTYRLDEDGKVLTPEELLYRCVQAINQSHDDAHVQMDVKLRSLVCLGLNEQVLHLWLEVLCSCVDVVQKWYQPWSFICSPGWVQIKCELRILSQFAFSLNPDWELPQKKEQTSQPLKDGVRDMLVKHHLFSWDL